MPGARNSTDGAMAPPCEFAAALAERDMRRSAMLHIRLVKCCVVLVGA